MRETLLAEEFEKLRTTKRKGAEQGEVGQSNEAASGTRRTRSQAAPEWTVHDALILVNEISAVEGECANALSTYQKWTIIAENCTALDVARTSNQCRRKWDSLLGEYKMITEWERRKRGISYWSLDSGRRKNAGLPLDFTEDLFKAIDQVAQTQEEQSGTDPDTDPEVEFDALNSKEIGSKKPRRRQTHYKGITETENELPCQSVPHKGITKEREHASLENQSQHQLARFKGINEEKEHVSTENQLKCQSTRCLGFTKEIKHVSPENESQHQRTSHKAITEETEHIIMDNESRYWSTSFKGLVEKEYASIDNDPQGQSTPCKGNTKENERESLERESQDATSHQENSEEKDHASIENKSWYQLTPDRAITEEKEHALVQNELWHQLAPNEQVSEEKDHVSTEKGYNSAISGAFERKQLLVAKLRENTLLIHAIIAGNLNQNTDKLPADMNYEKALESEIKRARPKADRLIACIADLGKNLDLLNNVVEECRGKTT